MPADLAFVRDSLELLALSGCVAPLILTNVSYRTRDALLLYSTLRFIIDVASLRRIPTGLSRTLLNVVHAWGIEGQLLHMIESEPIVISDINGQWSLQKRAVLVTVAALVMSYSNLEEATSLTFRIAALRGPIDLASSCLAVTAALWRAKRHESYPWTERLTLLERIHPKSDVIELLNRARQESQHKEEQENVTLADIREALAGRARMFCVILLTAIPLGYFDASGAAAAAIGLLTSPSFAPDLEFVGLVLSVLYSLGLDRNLVAQLVHLTQYPQGEGTEVFKGYYLTIHKLITERTGRTERTTPAVVALRRHGNRTPGVVADIKIMASSPHIRLENLLVTVCGILPFRASHEEVAVVSDDRTKIAKHVQTARNQWDKSRVKREESEHAVEEALKKVKEVKAKPDQNADERKIQLNMALKALEASREILKKAKLEEAESDNKLQDARKGWKRQKQEEVGDNFPPLSEHDRAAVNGMSSSAALAARAGAGLTHLLTGEKNQS